MMFNKKGSHKFLSVVKLDEEENSQRAVESVYEKPELIQFGDVRDVTLGGSPGGGDSGTPTTRRRR